LSRRRHGNGRRRMGRESIAIITDGGKVVTRKPTRGEGSTAISIDTGIKMAATGGGMETRSNPNEIIGFVEMRTSGTGGETTTGNIGMSKKKSAEMVTRATDTDARPTEIGTETTTVTEAGARIVEMGMPTLVGWLKHMYSR
jgi:hypothetical protein